MYQGIKSFITRDEIQIIFNVSFFLSVYLDFLFVSPNNHVFDTIGISRIITKRLMAFFKK